VDELARVVERRPTGALHHQRTPGGPLELQGPVTVRSADRRVALEGGAAKPCRCGQSRNQPFCDGSHLAVEFAAS